MGVRAHSVTIRPASSAIISPYVLFTEISLTSPDGSVKIVDPEIYPRLDGEIYACGPCDDSPLPDTVDNVAIDGAACDSVYSHVSSISPALRDGTVQKRQACFLPTVSMGSGPIIGSAEHIGKGLIIATGHTCWGISNAPATGRVLSEIVMEGKARCVSLRGLEPSVFID